MSFLWIVFCVLVGYFAKQKGRHPIFWGLLAFFFSPVLAGVLLILLDNPVGQSIKKRKKKAKTIGTAKVECSNCGGYVSSAASFCSNCGAEIDSEEIVVLQEE